MNWHSRLLLLLAFACAIGMLACGRATPQPTLQAPATVLPVDGQPSNIAAITPGGSAAAPSPKPLPRFVDVGTTTCAPCRVMLTVMEELEAEYAGSLKIEFVNMKNDPQTAEKLGIRTIPTQVFFSPDGKELFRHIGVMRVRDIVAKWAELGYRLESSKTSAK